MLETTSLPPVSLPFATSCANLKEGVEIFIPIYEEEYKNIAQPWEAAIIVKILGQSFSKDFPKKELQKSWSWKDNLEMISLKKGFYNIQCPNQTMRSEILTGGPWTQFGSHIWVQRWKVGFRPSSAKITEYRRWVAMPELPIELFNKSILERVGNTLGKTLKID